jgi:hypothetical protein
MHRYDSSVNSKSSMRTSFIISRRKGSFVFDQQTDRSDAEQNVMPLSRTIKNFSQAKRTPDKK